MDDVARMQNVVSAYCQRGVIACLDSCPRGWETPHGTMRLARDSSDHFYIQVGAVYVGGRVKAQRFGLGANRKEAGDKAQRIRALWETQDGVWTPEGIREAKRLSSLPLTMVVSRVSYVDGTIEWSGLIS